MARILTGVQSTGRPHLGNILGAILPAVELANKVENDSFLFIADLHSLTQIKDSKILNENSFQEWLFYPKLRMNPWKKFKLNDRVNLIEGEVIDAKLGLDNNIKNLKVHNIDLLDFDETEFDIIIIMDFISYHENPVQVISHISSLLSDNGVILGTSLKKLASSENEEK